jgi:hypothetical protein
VAARNPAPRNRALPPKIISNVCPDFLILFDKLSLITLKK